MNLISLRISRRTGYLVFTLLVAALIVWGQAETGQITGSVSDPTGAAVAGASVTVRNVDTGATRVTTSNADGVYAVTNLIPGDFEIIATADGFTTYKSRVTITVGSKVGMDVKLEVGKSTTVVEVTEIAAAVKVNTETQTITQTLTTPYCQPESLCSCRDLRQRERG